jgi:hypothetical protein
MLGTSVFWLPMVVVIAEAEVVIGDLGCSIGGRW